MEKKLKIKRWFVQYKSRFKCLKCIEGDTNCLDFHHVDKKKKKNSISKMVAQGLSVRKILSEIRKCVVLCSNCHRKQHYYEYKQMDKKRKVKKSRLMRFIYKIKNRAECPVCGENNVWCLDFHHRNPAIKFFGIGEAYKMRVSMFDLLMEILKCDLICSNCHRKKHSTSLPPAPSGSIF
jgi:5-methylcytosine-specific restriction endonuclease McrA